MSSLSHFVCVLLLRFSRIIRFFFYLKIQQKRFLHKMLIDQNTRQKKKKFLIFFKNFVERECYLDLIKIPFLCTLCLLTSVLFSAVIPVDVLEFQLIYFDSCKTRNIFLFPSYKILCVTLIKLKVNWLEPWWNC